MNQHINIEYVCYGNNGRSPMAEAIASDYIRKQGLADRITVSSSGCGLFPDGTVKATPETKAAFVASALENGVYAHSIPELLHLAGEIALFGVHAGVDSVNSCFYALASFEEQSRNQALEEIGLRIAGPCFQPTRVREDVHLILPVAKRPELLVRELYQDAASTPLIEVLPVYAGMNKLPIAFCELFPAYQRLRDVLIEMVPKSIERARRELLS